MSCVIVGHFQKWIVRRIFFAHKAHLNKIYREHTHPNVCLNIDQHHPLLDALSRTPNY